MKAPRSSRQVDLFADLGHIPAVRPPVVRAYLGADEIVVDNFAGGGGASSGVASAIGRDPDIAINHDAEAIAMHRANHPTTRHYTESVWEVDPVAACAGRPVALAWFSPDCKHHSKAKGGKPREQKIRGLAWVAVRWAQAVRPRIIALENVEEFKDWGPLVDGAPCPRRKGKTYRAFKRKLERLGYVVEERTFRSCDYGAPTTRKRLYMVARCDGKPIAWPVPSHGPGRSAPHRTAAECIDWSIPCPSIFDRERPLADKTLARIARGIRKYVLEAARPFIVPATHGDRGSVPDTRVHSVDEPLRTVTTLGAQFHVVTPIVVPVNHGGVGRADHRVHDAGAPLSTITGGARGGHTLSVAYMVHRSNGERVGQAPRIYDVEAPLGTIVAQGQKHALCAAFLEKTFGERSTGGWNGGAAADVPLGSVTTRDHHRLVSLELRGLDEVDGSDAGVDSHGGDRGALGRDGVEASRREAGAATRSATLRDEEQGRLPPGQGVPPREAVHGDGASPGLDGTAGRDPAGRGAQPQGRGEGEQPPGQPRVAHPRREPRARLADGAANRVEDVAGSQGGGDGDACGGATVLDDRPRAEGVADHGVSSRGHEVAAFLIRYNRSGDAEPLDRALPTLTTKPRFGLVTVTIDGEEYVIVDIGMRMLTPRELFRAQGFSDEYVIDPIAPNGKPLTKTAQIRMCGNSVTPPMAAAIAAANLAEAA